MKQITSVLWLVFLLTGCHQSITSTDLTKINGYWEIEKVILPDGGKKDYKVNETIDYFNVKGNKGYRQKVMPQFDGRYLTNGIKEIISISEKEGDFYINYTTNYGKWKETIVEIQDSVLVLKNKDNLEYHYKRQIPFTLK